MYNRFDMQRSNNRKTVEANSSLRGSLGLRREDIYSERKKNGINHPALQSGVSMAYNSDKSYNARPKNSCVELTRKSHSDKKQIHNLMDRLNRADGSSIYKK